MKLRMGGEEYDGKKARLCAADAAGDCLDAGGVREQSGAGL